MKRTTFRTCLDFFSIGLFLAFILSFFTSLRPELDETASQPSRILCAAPSVTEIAFALGQGHRVIGVSDFTTYPPEALEKEKIGGIANINMERITALQPDLLLVQGTVPKLEEYAQQKQIPLYKVTMKDLPTIYADILQIGYALACPAAAESLVARLQTELAAIQKKADQLPPQAVFLCISRKKGTLTNLLTTGQGTYLDQLVALCGGRNIFADLTVDYPQISKESLLLRKPDVILELQPDSPYPLNAQQEIQKEWQQMPLLPAVASGRVYQVTEDYILIPGPRMALAAQELFSRIHRDSVRE